MLVPVILVGSDLILNGVDAIRLAMLETDMAIERTIARFINKELIFSTAIVRMIAGIGILGVVGAEPSILVLSALLISGSALLLNNTSPRNRGVGILIPRT